VRLGGMEVWREQDREGVMMSRKKGGGTAFDHHR